MAANILWERFRADSTAEIFNLLQSTSTPDSNALRPQNAPTGAARSLDPGLISRYDLLQVLIDAITTVLGRQVHADEPLVGSGLDSLGMWHVVNMRMPLLPVRPVPLVTVVFFVGAIELRNTINARTGLELPATLVYDYPSATAICDCVLTTMCHETEGIESVDKQLSVALSPIALVLAITDVHTRLPAGDLADRIDRVRLDRWNVEAPMRNGQTMARFGGFVKGWEMFDPDLFSISPSGELAAPTVHMGIVNCGLNFRRRV